MSPTRSRDQRPQEDESDRADRGSRTLEIGRIRSCATARIGPDQDDCCVAEGSGRAGGSRTSERSSRLELTWRSCRETGAYRANVVRPISDRSAPSAGFSLHWARRSARSSSKRHRKERDALADVRRIVDERVEGVASAAGVPFAGLGALHPRVPGAMRELSCRTSNPRCAGLVSGAWRLADRDGEDVHCGLARGDALADVG
jgi:hypothetical protein